jgi:hypothetical protein
MRDSFLFGRGRHHFLPKRSFNAALSSAESASSRFSRVPPARLQPLGLRCLQPTERSFPFVDAGVADAMLLAAQIADRHASLMLLQNPDDLIFPRKSGQG